MAESTYDAIVVGARVAGAATAMLLARQGRRVLVVDRDRYGTDTLSTHALMRGAVYLLTQWGLLDRLVDADTPPIRQTRFDYGDDSMTVTIKPTLGVESLYAPRRTVLDALLVDAAITAGAEIRYGVTMTDLVWDGCGRVVGVRGRDRSGDAITARAPLTIGADGVRSAVATAAGAATVRTGAGGGAVIYGYWSQLPVDGLEWFYRPGHSAGLIPTNANQVCVFAGAPPEQLLTQRDGLTRTYHRLLHAATGGAAGRLDRARAPGRLRTWIGRPSFVRQAHGPGWVLVGDAGSFFDPLSTHGITDALRDADMLARSLAEARADGDVDGALARYGHGRDQIVGSMFDVVDQIASYGWSQAQLRQHLLELSSAMSSEAQSIANAERVVS